MAEVEATVQYGPVSVVGQYQCAVCYSPTTMRCSQCKLTRYWFVLLRIFVVNFGNLCLVACIVPFFVFRILILEVIERKWKLRTLGNAMILVMESCLLHYLTKNLFVLRWV